MNSLKDSLSLAGKASQSLKIIKATFTMQYDDDSAKFSFEDNISESL